MTQPARQLIFKMYSNYYNNDSITNEFNDFLNSNFLTNRTRYLTQNENAKCQITPDKVKMCQEMPKQEIPKQKKQNQKKQNQKIPNQKVASLSPA